jgi:recombination protein RecT
MSQVTVVDQVRNQLTAMTPQFAAALPKHVDAARFVRVVMTAVQMTPALLDADRRTLFASAMRASQMGLLPDGREGAIVTFKNQAQFMPMVAGIMKLVRNSGEISTWSVQAVYENDAFDFCLGDEEHITHKPALANRGKLIAVYSIVTMKDGEKSREVMSVEDVNAIRARSRSGNSGPWQTDYSEMAKKTVVRRHSKRLPLSTDIDGMIKEDDELFMPEQDAPEAAQAPEAPSASKRPSRLQKVVEQAPAPAEEKHWHDSPSDDDGVIDMPTTDAAGQQPANQTEEHDSPI